MKKAIEQLPDDLRKAVMSAIQDYIDMVDECDFDLNGEVGVINKTQKVGSELHIYADADVYWEAEITFEIEASYSAGDYLTPSSYDIESIEVIEVNLLYVSVEGEEFVEYEN